MLKHLTLKSTGFIKSSKICRDQFTTTRNTPKKLLSTLRDVSFETEEHEIAEAKNRYENIIDIKQTPVGYGLFAAKSFSEGDKVMVANVLDSFSTRNSHSIQKDWNTHVLIDLPARFVNHSCEANLGIQDIPDGGFDFFALRTIEEGDEILWDYETMEYEISAFEMCMCGAERCRGKLGGFKKHGDLIKQFYGSYYGNYLKE